MKTLTQRQDACIARMLEPRTSARRSFKNCCAALSKFRKESARIGYSTSEIAQQVQDVKDMAALISTSED